MNTFTLSTIDEAIADFKEGKFVIVVDDEDRENEGDLIIAAEKITPEKVNFMLKNARGVLCAPITMDRCRELELPHQVDNNTSVLGTPFTITVDKLEGCTTGVSAHDRAATIKALADPNSTPHTFGRPGHINPHPEYCSRTTCCNSTLPFSTVISSMNSGDIWPGRIFRKRDVTIIA